MSGTHDTTAGHGSLRSYAVGFALAVILTVIPFWMVMHGGFSSTAVLVVILGLALVQIVVHLVFFLHMNGGSEQRWNLTALLFTALIVLILMAGSLWIMFHLDQNMMGPMPLGQG